MRTGTANTYAHALDQLFKRQSALASQQEKLSTGLKVNRASDDPTGAAQAERARARLSRIETDQRALELQRNAIASAESALGQANGLVQGTRDLLLAAGNAAYSAADRTTLAQQITNLRDQLLDQANRSDSNGVALFGGLGSPGAPFTDPVAGVQFQAVPGQRAPTATSLPGAMDGQAIWMNVPSGNGVFATGLAAGNSGSAWSDSGAVVSPAALTGNNYSVAFSVVAGVTTYGVVNTTTSATVATGQPYVAGTAIQFDGMSLVVRGAPANGDAVTVAPSTPTNLFQILDAAATSINGASNDNRLAQAIGLALTQIDTGLERLQAARSQAGDWLNRADSITSAQEARTIALEDDRARAEGLDMVKGISDFNQIQTGYQAALQSYAQIQRLSLFNFIN